MATCDACGREENLPYECRHCGGTYCADHRLPENHDCPGLENWGDPGGVFDSGFDDSVSDGSTRRGRVKERIAAETGTGGVFAYFRGNMTYVFLGAMWATFALQWLVTIVEPSLYDVVFPLQSNHIERVWTWFLSVFAHSRLNFFHIAFNSIVLYFFGPIVERRVGTWRFAALFVGAGVVAGLAQVGVALATGETAAVVGASGAIMAVMGVLTVLNPNLRVYLYFILPMPLWVLTIGFALLSLFFVAEGGIGAGNVAHLAHLSGLLIGLAYGEVVKREGTQAPQQLRFGGPGMGGRRRF